MSVEGMDLEDAQDSVQAGSAQPLKVDAHVHVHPNFDLEISLNAAARRMDLSLDAPTGILLLTEMADVDRFSELRGQVGRWKFTAYDEPESTWGFDDMGRCLLVVAGRQIVTEEGLEVHAFGTRAPFPDGAPLEETLKHLSDAGILAALPWGFGKWSGSRGEIVARLAGNAPPPGLFLADSGARMRGARRPRSFEDAEANGWVVLAGTDPLPLDGQDDDVGRYGMEAPIILNGRRPYAGLATWLRGLKHSPKTYGMLQSPMRFAGSQVTMQLRKRLGS